LCAATLALPALPAAADPPPWAPAHGRRAHEEQAYNYAPYTAYDRHHRRYQERRLGRNDYVWRGNDGRYYCRRSDGTTGLIIGGAVGALLGSQIAGRGDRTLGALLGGAGGALLGRSVDRGDLRCR
jgi:hypothetical protein